MTTTEEQPREAMAAQIEALAEALKPFAAITEGEVYAKFVVESGHTFRLTNGDGSRSLTFINAECFDAARQALANLPAIVTALRQAEAAPGAEQCVMVCPQCEGEGGYPDGVDEAACHTDCARCGSNGWIVDTKALARQRGAREDVTPHVFLDCDGVLADFDTYAEAYFGMPPRQYEKQMGSSRFWQELEAKGDFYRNLPLMPDAMALYEAVKHLHPTILTGCPRGDWAQGQKVAWAAEHFPGVPIITCRSADKRDYAKPGDVLIDDWPQHRHRWIEMGGVFIVHRDAESSLAALRAHYPKLPTAPATDEGEA